ncbi:MAG TPA: ATP-binding cassette domain-containing protein [Candidatus Polarisedimenticolia bacterium]|nr:ATP-binding cassette domain-containing protein [Candidatus Polarisedimenticolia bacterium]
MDVAVSLQNLVKTFGTHRAVDGVSLDIPKGIIFGLIGPNGAGKTTTIRMILDILRPDSGEVRIMGQPAGDKANDRIGYLPEERGLYRKTKVLDMLEYLGALRGGSPSEARQEASGWLDRMQLADWKTHKVEDLSKGMQQKIQLIGAILRKPELLILDEPFSGLDPVNQDMFKDLMLDLNRGGATIIFSTHQMETAEKLCKEIALINRGRLVLQGPLGQVKARFGKNSVLVEFDGDGTFLTGLPGVARVDDYGRYQEIRLTDGADPQSLLRAAVGRVTLRRFEIVEPTLHNIFLEQVGGRTADA